jgi:hypothetical protein
MRCNGGATAMRRTRTLSESVTIESATEKNETGVAGSCVDI